MPNPQIFVEPGRIVVNDGTHGPHDDENPDDGTLSPFSVALGEALKQLGFEVQIKTLS
jgi:hypothetical protein